MQRHMMSFNTTQQLHAFRYRRGIQIEPVVVSTGFKLHPCMVYGQLGSMENAIDKGINQTYVLKPIRRDTYNPIQHWGDPFLNAVYSYTPNGEHDRGFTRRFWTANALWISNALHSGKQCEKTVTFTVTQHAIYTPTITHTDSIRRWTHTLRKETLSSKGISYVCGGLYSQVPWDTNESHPQRSDLATYTISKNYSVRK